MSSCIPIKRTMTGRNASEAIHRRSSMMWQLIDWGRATLIVKSLQARIVKAVQAHNWKNIRDLQRLLNHSTSAKVLAIRRVTENTGKRTAGVDGELWDSPKRKYDSIKGLKNQGYKASPVRRIKIPKSNGKMRPLGIPTMQDRAMQALHLLGLDPISETLGDKNSYGFRPYRSCADAITKCHKILSRRTSAVWILEGDIKGCFDNISHDWLLKNIPMNKGVLSQWLKSGYMEKGKFYDSESGTPQGSVISPTLSNMVLDGLSKRLDEALGIQRRDNYYKNPYKVHLIRYADDFIVTASDKSILSKKVKPIIEVFLDERGLELSESKTKITHINDGFDFLGKHLRKYHGKLIIKPSKTNVKEFLRKVQETIRKHRSSKTSTLIGLLTPKIRGWCMYHRMDCSKQTFAYVDHRIWKMLWQWALRRHPMKSKGWLKQRYFKRSKGVDWTLFAYDENSRLLTLMRASQVSIQRHIIIRGAANPYDVNDELYFEGRADQLMRNNIAGRNLLLCLYNRQKGFCSICHQKLTKQTGAHIHHKIPKYLGGKSNMENLVLLHPVCHMQLHHGIKKVTTVALTISV